MSTRQQILAHKIAALLRAQQRSFTSSIIHSKSKVQDQQPPPPPPQQSSQLDKINLPSSLRRWEAFTYSDFMTKVQKKNPEIQFTKQLADDSLEKIIVLAISCRIWKVVVRQLNGGPAAKQRTEMAVIRDWKRLQSGSEEYWEGKGRSQ